MTRLQQPVVLIGGASDGQRHLPFEGSRNLTVPVQYRFPASEYPLPAALVDVPAVHEHFVLEAIRTETETFWFFRHTGLTLEQALHKLFQNYRPPPP